MADIKFACPQCKQKIAVDGSATGVKVDCPRCRSTLVIPPSSDAPVGVVVRRQLAFIAEEHADLHEALEEQRQEATKAKSAANSAEGTLKALQEAVTKANREGEAARQETVKARGALARAQGDLDTARADLTTKMAEVAQERDGHTTLQKSLAAVQAELATAHQELATAKAEWSKAQSQAAAHTSEQERAREQAASIQKELESARAEIVTLQAQPVPAPQDAAQRAALELELKASRERETVTGAALQSAKDALKSLRGSELRKEAEKQRATAELRTAQEKITAGEQGRKEVETRLSAVQKELADLVAARMASEKEQSKVGDLEGRIEGLVQERDAALVKANEREAAHVALAAERDALLKSRDAVTAEVASLKTGHEQVAKELADLRAETTKGREEAAGKQRSAEHEWAERLKASESAVAVLKSELALGSTRSTDFEQDTKSLQAALQKMQAERDAALQQKEQSASSIQAELAKLQEAAVASAAEQKRLGQELAQSDENGRNLRVRADELTAELESFKKTEEELQVKLNGTTKAQETGVADLEKASAEAARLEQALAAEKVQGRKEADRLQGLLATATKEHERAWAGLAMAEKRVAAVEGELRDREDGLAESRMKLGELRREHEKALEQNIEMQRESEAAKGRLAAAITNVDGQQEKFSTATQALEAERKKNSGLTAERDQLIAQVSGLATDRSSVAEELRQARTELAEAKNRAAGLPPLPIMDGQAPRVVMAEQDPGGEVEALKAALDRAKQHVSVLQTRRDQMRDEIAQLKIALGRAPDAIS